MQDICSIFSIEKNSYTDKILPKKSNTTPQKISKIAAIICSAGLILIGTFILDLSIKVVAYLKSNTETPIKSKYADYIPKPIDDGLFSN